MPSKISWTDETWNPVIGCSKVSDGCKNCYAERMANRLAGMGNTNYQQVSGAGISKDDYGKWTGKTVCVESRLTIPPHWRNPRKIFVCSMGDLFHESVPFEFIDKVFAVMALCPQHTFQVLTKRAERMLEYLKDADKYDNFGHRIDNAVLHITNGNTTTNTEWNNFKNVWLGVTAENQEMAEQRHDHLSQITAAKTFWSVEPMLSGINCDKVWNNSRMPDLIICGGETGPGARPMDIEWARSLRNQCQDAGVPFHFKNKGGNRKRVNGHLLDGIEYRPEL